MRTTIFLAALLISLTVTSQNNLSASEGPYNQLIIRGATLINGNGAPPISPVDISVENNKISAIDVVGYP